MAEYGLIKDTTLTAIADGLREQGIIPETREETILADYADVFAFATSETDPTFNTNGIGQTNKNFVSIPGATSLRFDVQVGRVTDGAGSPVCYIYFYNKNGSYLDYFNMPYGASEPKQYSFTYVMEDNAGYIEVQNKANYAQCGMIAKVYPLDADGNEIHGMIAKEVTITNTLTPEAIAEAITNFDMPAVPPEEVFTLTGTGNYKFANGSWDWFIDLYGDKITTVDLNSLTYFCYQSKSLKNIPFVINVKGVSQLANAFNGCEQLLECPKIRGTNTGLVNVDFSSIVQNCFRLRDLNDLFEPEFFDFLETIKITSTYSCVRLPSFYNCYSMRRIPSWVYKYKLSQESTAFPYSSYTLYYNFLYYAYSVDEALNIPVWTCTAPATSNMFTSTVTGASRLKDFTFETNNGQPIEAKWKSQTLDFTSYTGYANIVNYITQYNSGITADKEVKDDATYQALKNDPDWFTDKLYYSRYNHDSAVNTINSLPDTSAYLATAGGTNTIKFKKASGSKTDGGAIENLTAEEIAVATAKGWTVTLS